MDFVSLAQMCAPQVHIQTMQSLVQVESGFNPYAIGVVGNSLVRQPKNLPEALATARELERLGYNYSVGYGQVNKKNFKAYGLTLETAFEPCANLKASASILSQCFKSASGKFASEQGALRAAFSCYYSGNFTTGLRPDFKGQPSYVDKVYGVALGRRVTNVIPLRQEGVARWNGNREVFSGKKTDDQISSKENSALVF